MIDYYNEIDPYPAQWIRNLIEAGHLPPGDVDERSIEDVRPSDLVGYRNCHFFAGIGVWALALRNARWPDDRQIWTASCPCQPFSAAGKGAGFADERHLWPALHYLIEECRPAIVVGEQVASPDVNQWLDLVQTDLEGLDYDFAATAFPAASIGAPHIRDRTYWLGHADDARSQGWGGMPKCTDQFAIRPHGVAGTVADAHGGVSGQGSADVRGRIDGGDAHPGSGFSGGGVSDGMGRANNDTQSPQRGICSDAGTAPDRNTTERSTGPTNGFWRDADWLLCRDGKWRPVEPGTFPLVDGATSRMGRLRAYGNAVVEPQAREFIQAVMDCLPS